MKKVNYRTVSHHYNNNKFEDTLNIITRRDKTIHASLSKDGNSDLENSYCVDLNGQKKRVDFILDLGHLQCKTNFSISIGGRDKIEMIEGERFTPWDIYVLFEHKGNDVAAINLYSLRFLRVELPHVKVNGNVFVKILIPTTRGTEIEVLKPYKRLPLKEKYGTDYIDDVHDYDDFVMFPDNINHKPVIGNCYNHFSKFMHSPSDSFDEEKIKHSMGMIKHIFGEQWELGMVYMQQIYLNPMQRLPILGLASKANKTGKTTFGRWLRSIYGYNSVTIGPTELNSQFNYTYARSNIVIIDEANFQDFKILEKIKSLATADTLSVNQKGVDNHDIEWFAKILMFSNDENDFVNISKAETRYWIRKIPTIPGGTNDNIHDLLREEIPFFLAKLKSMPKKESQGRTFFSDSEIQTKELTETKKNSEDKLFRDIKDRLSLWGEDHPKQEILYFRANEFRDRFYLTDKQVTINVVTKSLKNEGWKMDASPNYNARCWCEDQIKKISRTYSYKNPFWDGVEEDKTEIQKESEDNVPF